MGRQGLGGALRCRGRKVAVETGVRKGARACVAVRTREGRVRTHAHALGPHARAERGRLGLGGPFRRRPHGRACYGTAAYRRVRLAWMILYMPHP